MTRLSKERVNVEEAADNATECVDEHDSVSFEVRSGGEMLSLHNTCSLVT